MREKKPFDAEVVKKLEPLTSKWMSLKECKEFERTEGVKYKRGKLSVHEEQTLGAALEEYLSAKSISKEEFEACLHTRSITARGAKIRDLFVFLARQLKTRPVMLVYLHLVRRYHPLKRKERGNTWTKEEEQQLKQLVAVHGFMWEVVGKELGRISIDCRDHYRTLREGLNKGPWSDEETAKLLDIIKGIQRARVEKGLKMTNTLPWVTISDALQTRNITQCYVKWHECRNPYNPRSLWSDGDDYRLCLKLWDLNLNHESEVMWSELISKPEPEEYLEGAIAREQVVECKNGNLFKVSPVKLKSRFHVLKRRISGADKMEFDDVLELLIRALRPKSEEFINDEE